MKQDPINLFTHKYIVSRSKPNMDFIRIVFRPFTVLIFLNVNEEVKIYKNRNKFYINNNLLHAWLKKDSVIISYV